MNMVAKPLRVAVIGAGYFSQFHVDAWRRNSDTELVAIADTNEQNARDLAADDANIAVYGDAASLLSEQKVDIVDVVVPPAAHLDMLRLILAYDVAIICQKPFCGTLANARQALDMIEEAGRLVVVHENFRFQPWYRKIKSLIDEGLVGDLYQVTYRLRPGDGQGADAYLARQPYFQKMERFLIHETGVHWVDTFRYLLGEPKSVLADLRRLNPAISGEDSGFFIYRYDDGRRALFDGNRLVDHVAENSRRTMGELIVEGAKGVLSLNGDGEIFFRQMGSAEATLIASAFSTDGFGGDCVYALQRHVSDHLLHGAPIENEARDYVGNIVIEEAIYESAASGAAVQTR
ncbi:MAG: Gfo/Idh/MocA family oxidoreductase [Stappiaceae bacterium]